MSTKQYMALCRQTARPTFPGSPTYKFYKVKDKLYPVPEYKEEATREWAGQDFAQGDTAHSRSSSSWKYDWVSRLYPSAELAMLLEFLFGYASTETTVDTSGKKVMFYTVSDMYEDSSPLADAALTLLPHTTKPGSATTTCQRFIGGRIKDGEMSFKGGEDAELKLSFMGGPWISAPEQTEVAGMSFTANKKFKSGNLTCFLGAGATLTGTAPLYTEIAPNTMPQFKPDDLTLKIEPGIDDKFKMNGEDGPSVTERTGSINITAEFTIDFSDPSSGWSSYDAWVAYYSDIQYAPLMLKLDSGEICGSSTQTRQLLLYFPKMKISNDGADYKNDGSKTKIKFKLESLIDASIGYAGFGKLVY